MPRPAAYLICSALLVAFIAFIVVPILAEMGRRTAGPFSPDARIDSSQVRIVKPDTLSFTVGLTLDYIEVVTRHESIRAGIRDRASVLKRLDTPRR